ncbi:MAG: Dabb family protein [Oscillospiraceae bacterium]|nr:Dabb family protein [Oscillospiraceae bacterium]
MIKHIILWKLKEENNNISVKEGIKAGLEGLAGKIPGLVEINVQICGLESSTADVMLNSVFEDEAALKGYSKHPEHLFVADNFVRPFTQTRLCLDFEV